MRMGVKRGRSSGAQNPRRIGHRGRVAQRKDGKERQKGKRGEKGWFRYTILSGKAETNTPDRIIQGKSFLGPASFQLLIEREVKLCKPSVHAASR
jgi:hypothetical protein